MKSVRFAFAILACALIGLPVWAADEFDEETSGVGGTIPELCQIVVSGTGCASLLTLTQDGSGEVSYDQGYVESTANAIILTLDANKQWQLSGKIDTWSCPGTYNKDEDDLLIRITNTPTGTIQNSFNAYHTLGAVNTTMLSHTAGVSNNAVNVQARVLLDWTQDIPGPYSITITWTMETTT
jgi:hypothetical protein